MILELETQFQLMITSIVYSMVITNLYTFIEIIFQKIRVLKSLAIFSLLVAASGLFYYFIYLISEGVLTIYLPVFLAAGYYLHMRFYDKYFSCLYKYLFLKLCSIIKKKKDRCKQIWKGLITKKAKEEESTE